MWLQEWINQYDNDGKMHGFWKSFYMHSDKIKAEESYIHGFKNGLCRYFWTNGEVSAEGLCENDFKIGLWKYYFDESSSKEVIYIR